MAGPYDSSREVFASPTLKAWSQMPRPVPGANTPDLGHHFLLGVVHEALEGVALGKYDREVLVELVRRHPATTVLVLVGIFSRARRAPAELQTSASDLPTPAKILFGFRCSSGGQRFSVRALCVVADHVANVRLTTARRLSAGQQRSVRTRLAGEVAARGLQLGEVTFEEGNHG